MSTNPDPVFEPATFPYGDVLSESGSSGNRGSLKAETMANPDLGLIAGAIEELQDRLAEEREQIRRIAVDHSAEYEIGRLIAEAQRLSEASLSRLEMQIQNILEDAQAKAAEIVREASEEAAVILRQAGNGSQAPDMAAKDLQTAVAGFANINNELVKELNVLNDVLSAAGGTGSHTASKSTPDDTTDH